MGNEDITEGRRLGNNTFPITFASACFSVTCCDELTSTYDGDVESFVRNIKTNSVDIRYRSDHLGRNLRWLALGVEYPPMISNTVEKAIGNVK